MNQSYPFEPGPVLLENAWYVAAWSSEVGRTPLGRTVLGRRVVLYRTEAGEAVALADRCPHRGFQLSKGRLAGDAIECGYHGFTFDAEGRCVAIPSQDRVPAGFHVRGYPTVERWKWVWIWMGPPGEADESLLPDHAAAGLGVPGWLAEIGCDFFVRARYQLFNENLLDLTHLTFLHPGTIGTPGIAGSGMRVESGARTVRVLRETLEEEATPLYAKRLGIAGGRVDRRHVTTFVAPSFHVIHVVTTQAASAANGAPAALYGEHKIVHALTPETETTTRDYWAFSRTYNHAAEISDYLRRNLGEVIRQDIDALESVENLLNDPSAAADISCAADEASLKGRRLLQGLLRQAETLVGNRER